MKAKTIIPIALSAIVILVMSIVAPRVIRAQNEGRQVPVLMYHGFADDPGGDVWTVSTAEFERQMREMQADGRKAITPHQLALAARGFFLLPRKPVVITMDDGFRDNVTIAEPILRKYGMKGICYLIISHIGDSQETRSQYRERDNLIWPEVRDAIARGTLSFGSHSVSHSPNASRQAREVASSRHIFHEKTGAKANAYCYPNGYAPDLIWEAVRYKRRFTTAMICSDTLFTFTGTADFYRIPRISIYGGNHEFTVDSVTWEKGVLSAQVVNKGATMPIRCVLRDRKTGRAILSEGPPRRIGGGHSHVFSWADLPEGFSGDDSEIVVSEQNGLFTYGTPVPVPPKNGESGR